MPHLVGDYLHLGVLHDEAHGLRALGGAHVGNAPAVYQRFAAALALRHEGGLEMPQQGGLAAAAPAAEHYEFAAVYAEAHIVKGFFARERVCKTQIFEKDLFHLISSARS